jgi:hypothetical protein
MTVVTHIERGRNGMKNVLFVVAVLVGFLTGFLGYSDIVIACTCGSCKVDRDGGVEFTIDSTVKVCDLLAKTKEKKKNG